MFISNENGILFQIKSNQVLTNMLFADELKELRERKQLLQRQLASALEIDTPIIWPYRKRRKKIQTGTSHFIGIVT